MATGSSADDETAALERPSSPGGLGRRLLVGLVCAPGRSAAMALVVLPYLWLLGYAGTTALGLRGDPVVAGDWLTLVFTSYALLSSLALAHRILTVGIHDLTEEYLIDVVALTWLTGFYFVWMMAREPVAASTTAEELYGPVLDGQPGARALAGVLVVTALVTAWLIHRSNDDTQLFRTEFRTALVTLPGAVTATVVVVQPGPESLVWPVIGGVFVGTGLAGVVHVQEVASWTAKGAFAICSLLLWTVGAVGWAVVYRSRPPNEHIVLDHVAFGRPARKQPSRVETSDRSGRTAGSGTDDE